MGKKSQQGFFVTEKDVFAFVATKTSVDLFRTKRLSDESFVVQTEGGDFCGKEEDWINYYGFKFSSKQAAINHFIADSTLSPGCQPPVFTDKENQKAYDSYHFRRGGVPNKKLQKALKYAQAKILSNAMKMASYQFKRDLQLARSKAKTEIAHTLQGRKKK